MLDLLICLSPCFTCFTWCYLLFGGRGQGQTRQILAWMALLAGINFLLDAYLNIPDTDNNKMVIIELLYLFVTPSIFSLFIIAIKKMEGQDLNALATTLLFTPSLLLGSSGLIIYMTLGMEDSAAYLEAFRLAGGHPAGWSDDIYTLRDFVCIDLYRAVLAIWITVTAIACVRFLVKKKFSVKVVKDFFFHNRPIDTSLIVAWSFIIVLTLVATRLAVGRAAIAESMPLRWTMAMLMTISVFNGFFTGFRFDGAMVDYLHFKNFGLVDAELKEFREAQRRKAEAAAGMIRNEDTLIKLKDLFVEYMDIDKPYLNPELTLDDMASVLKTNRTYLSAMLKNIMGVSFKSYINGRRIEAVQEALREHPNDNLSEIADRTGFSSDSQLIKKFSEVVGESPKTWIKRQRLSEIRQK